MSVRATALNAPQPALVASPSSPQAVSTEGFDQAQSRCDIMNKARIVGLMVREISDEIGCTVRFGYRQGDECIPEPCHTVTIEQHGAGLPAGHVMGSGSSPDKALGEALARYADATGHREAA